MQREYLIETRSVTDEYYLIEEKRLVSPAPIYRICIKKSLAECPGVEETESTPPVSDSESRAREMLRGLIKNAVTPVCLLEIVDDMMSLESGQAS